MMDAPGLEQNYRWVMQLGYSIIIFNPMKVIGIIAFIVCLCTWLSKAGDCTRTNNMPEQIHNLMDIEGYALDHPNSNLSKQTTNLLRNFQFMQKQQFTPFELPAKKASWSLWNNSNFNHVGRNSDQINVLSPSAALALYEYEITYSFEF